MDEKDKEQKPEIKPQQTIRIGTEMISDVIDYVCLIRTHNDKGEQYVKTFASDMNWAHGAMASEIGFIDHLNSCWGHSDEGEEFEGEDD